MCKRSNFWLNVLVGGVCAAFLGACLGAVGARGHRHAKAMVCLSNLSHWGQVFDNFAMDHNGSIALGTNSWGYW